MGASATPQRPQPMLPPMQAPMQPMYQPMAPQKPMMPMMPMAPQPMMPPKPEFASPLTFGGAQPAMQTPPAQMQLNQGPLAAQERLNMINALTDRFSQNGLPAGLLNRLNQF